MILSAEDFNRRKAEYDILCNEVNAAYQELEKENEANSKGKTYMRAFPACKEINLWTYWQGHNAMAPKILVVGQDFGCPFGSAFGNEADYLQSIGKTEQDGGLHYFDIYGDKKISATDVNLAALFRSLGCGYDNVIGQRYDDIFFTNICLGYRNDGNSGGFKKSWITNIEKTAYPKLLSILKPKVIVCLGQHTYDYFLNVMELEDTRNRSNFNQFIEENCKNPFKVRNIPVFAVAHCGAMGTLNRNRSKCKKGEKVTAKLDIQIEDWSYIKQYL